METIKIKVRRTTFEERVIYPDEALGIAKKVCYGKQEVDAKPHLQLHDLVKDSRDRIGLVTGLLAEISGVRYRVAWMSDILTDAELDEVEEVEDNLGIRLTLIHRQG